MIAAAPAEVASRLQARREQLAEAAARSAEAAALLPAVDDGLTRVAAGSWPLCRDCRVPIDPELLEVAPAATVCFDCLSEPERRALERDLAGAARIQRALLPPRRVEHGGWEVAWSWEPHGAVSGDHVDILAPARATDGGQPLLLTLGDVAGKGIAASLLQSHLHALFRALAREESPLPDLLGSVNGLFAGAIAGGSAYATLVAARLHLDGVLEVANAGHPRPLLADGRGVRPIEGAGVPLGMFGEASYDGSRVALAPGDLVLLYTDGLVEATRGEEELGIGRTAASLRRHARRPLPELLAALRSELDVFLDGAPCADDLTVMAVRWRG